MPTKLKMHTSDKATENFEKLSKLFPNAVTETINENGEVVRAIDKDTLMQEISCTVVEGNEERYQFTWPDKRKSLRQAFAPTTDTLRPVRAESVGRDGTPGGFDSENLYVEGDNLEVLKLLQETYLGRVKMIYIDPPYNTGSDFVYHDDFAQSAADYKAASGQFDDAGNRLVQNLESNGRFHTDWLNMIYPRLKIAKNLLADDGVIFISIDDNEVANLRKVCDEIFGASNFVAQFAWAAGRKNDSKHVSISHEYIVTYFKSAKYIADNKIVWRERKQGLDDIYATYDSLRKKYGKDNKAVEKALKAWYSSLPDGHPAKDHSHYSRVDDKGVFFAADISWPGGGGPKYEVLHPVTGKPVAVPSRGWIFSEDRMKEQIAAGRVLFGEDERGVPTLKAYLNEHEKSVPYSVFYKDGRAASKRLKTLLGDKVFENPKDEEIIKRLIEFSGTGKNDIVLDFFSGSGTTAHALMLAEAEKPLGRKFILVQLPEAIDPDKASSEKAKKVARNAIAFLDSLNAKHNICEIGKERIRRASRKIREENATTLPKDFDGGFRVLRLDSSNMQDVYYKPADQKQGDLLAQVQNLKSDRTVEDLLFQVMLDLGVPLSAKIEETTIDGKKVFNVDDNYLIACFDKNITERTIQAVAKQNPYYFVMQDSSMANDSVATNFDQIFATYSPDTVRKVL